MRVVIKDFLNVRVGAPSVNAPCHQFLAPGSTIEVEDRTFLGDSFEGINTWYKDVTGNYYWTGGTTNPPGNVLKIAEPFQGIINYNRILSTANPLPGNEGDGVNIALLDSGVNVNHVDLAGAVIQSRSFINGLSATNDVWGHGTLMAGFIGARAKTPTGIVGVAPKCKIYNFKICNDQGVIQMSALKDCFNFIIGNQGNLGVRIINLSISVSDLSFVSHELNQLSGLGIKIIVAAGNESLLKLNFVRLLAQHAGTLGVGTIESKDYFTNAGILPASLKCFYFNQKLYSTSSGSSKSYEDVSGDSIFTAITTGLFATMTPANNLGQFCFQRNTFNTTGIKPFI